VVLLCAGVAGVMDGVPGLPLGGPSPVPAPLALWRPGNSSRPGLVHGCPALWAWLRGDPGQGDSHWIFGWHGQDVGASTG